jgi:arginase
MAVNMIEHMSDKKQIGLLGVPLDLGAGRRGVDMGPSALRYAQLAKRLTRLGHSVRDHGNVAVPVLEALVGALGEPLARFEDSDPSTKSGWHYLEAILAVCSEACERLRQLPEEVFPVTIGGDHSLALGTVSGAARPGRRLGLIWLDAHSDINVPESSPSGNIHGMPVAHLLGLGDARLATIGGPAPKVLAEDIVMIGIRSVDSIERELLREHGITVYTMKEVDRLGIARISEMTLERLSGLSHVHLSFDADALDPSIAPGVGTPVPGGLSYREAHLLMELFADSGQITSLDLVEVNPVLDRENTTAKVMVEMAASFFGQKIL